jgi:hypothetical protein
MEAERNMRKLLVYITTNIKQIAKSIWWLILLACITVYIYLVFDRIANQPTKIDYIVISLGIILVFMPFISEIEILGISLKKQIDNIKKDVDSGFIDIQKQLLDIRISNNQISTMNQNINFTGAVPTRDEVESAKTTTEDLDTNIDISPDLIYLFSIRYNLEQKIRKIAGLYKIEDAAYGSLLNILIKYEIIEINIRETINKVRNICNRAIHGEIISDEYVNYVKYVMPEIFVYLDKLIKDKEDSLSVLFNVR